MSQCHLQRIDDSWRSRDAGSAGSPPAIPAASVERILQLRDTLATAGPDAGPDTIAWHLTHHHDTVVWVATISRYLVRAGLVNPEPKKQPKSAYIRFQPTMPNET